MELMEDKVKKIKEMSLEIESLIGQNNLVDAKLLVEKYSKLVQNSTMYAYQAIIAFQEGKNREAIAILNQGVIEHRFSFSLYFNLGFMYAAVREIDLSLENYIYAVKFSLTEEEKKLALDGLQEIIELAVHEGLYSAKVMQSKVNSSQKLLQQYYEMVYPIDTNGVSMIRKRQKENTSDEYLINMYNANECTDVDLQSRMLYKSELVKGKNLKGKREWRTNGPVVLPISKISDNTVIKISVNDEKYVFIKRQLPINQFNYIKITEPGKIVITANSEVFVGEPIEIDPPKKPVRFSLKIFVDGLSYEFLEKNELDKIMPNTYRFFKEGFISNNCYTTSEWTLPSKSSINTGLYATQHKMLQPDHFYTFQKSHKLLAEYFQEQGYYCANISTNWRTTPTLGYHRGFDRMIYQNFIGGMDGKEVVMETIEHLMSFNKTNNFMTISLMDLHNVPDEIENHLFSQVKTDIKDRLYKNKIGETSVQTKYDESKVVKYREEIRRVDGILSILYDYILKNYSQDEFVVTLHSDHGQSFLDNEFNLLSDSRLKVPFMMRGRNVPVVQSDELIETVDILPSILSSCELELPKGIDGELPKSIGGDIERSFTFTQIIHPNQTYKVRIKEKELSYYLETKDIVNPDLTVNLEGYNSKIIDDETGSIVTDQWLDLKVKYDEFVFNKIKNMLRWTT